MSIIKDRIPDDGYITWTNDQERSIAIKQFSNAIDEFRIIEKTGASNNLRSFIDIDTNLTARTEFTRKDYEYFRPSDALPNLNDQKAVISFCMSAYDKVGIVRNVIDLMSDFACQGIELVHRSPTIQNFYKQWFRKVSGKERSERFLNHFYRMGNVVVKRQTGKFNESDIDRLRKTVAEVDIDVEWMPLPEKNEVAARYVFLNPLTLDVIGKELAAFTGKVAYVLRIPPGLISKISYPKPEEQELISLLSPEIINAVKSGINVIPLDPNKVSVYFYKKDDWQIWSNPMTSSILQDLIILQKMKLMDIAAADTAISSVRLWRLGSLEEKIFPTKQTVAKLANLIMNNVGGGSYDLIWGPELDFKESSSNAFQFLGPEKYVAVYNAIYQGLGVPPSLTGQTDKSGFTNNALALKTLIDRLEYGRTILRSFWEKEIELVRQAMGFRFPAELRFEHMTLSDQAAEKALLVQLVDRDLISMETLIERFGENPLIEKARMVREKKQRKSNKIPKKASPWHNPQQDFDFKKIFTQLGVITPSELGLELEDRKEGEKTKQEQLNEIAEKRNVQATKNNRGIPQQGRPKNSRDKQQRKQKRVLPRSSASAAMIWAKTAQEQISKIILPGFMKEYDKTAVKQFTAKQFKDFESIKAAILYDLEPFVEINDELVYNILVKNGGLSNKECFAFYSSFTKAFIEEFGREPTVDEDRQLKCIVYISQFVGD